MGNPRPVKEIRLGSIKAAIWENQSDSGPFYNVTVSRLYKSGEDWKSSDSFGRDDLPLLGKVVDRTHDWILENPELRQKEEKTI